MRTVSSAVIRHHSFGVSPLSAAALSISNQSSSVTRKLIILDIFERFTVVTPSLSPSTNADKLYAEQAKMLRLYTRFRISFNRRVYICVQNVCTCRQFVYCVDLTRKPVGVTCQENFRCKAPCSATRYFVDTSNDAQGSVSYHRFRLHWCDASASVLTF